MRVASSTCFFLLQFSMVSVVFPLSYHPFMPLMDLEVTSFTSHCCIIV